MSAIDLTEARSADLEVLTSPLREAARSLVAFAESDFPSPDDNGNFKGPGGPRMSAVALAAILRVAQHQSSERWKPLQKICAAALERLAPELRGSVPNPIPWNQPFQGEAFQAAALSAAAMILDDWDVDTHHGSHPVPPRPDELGSLLMTMHVADLITASEVRREVVGAATEALADLARVSAAD